MTLLSFAIVMWVTEAASFAVTSILVMILMALLGATEGMEVVTKKGVVAVHGAADGLVELIKIGFGNSLVFFFLGVFLLTGAFVKSGLGERMTLVILRVLGTGTRMVVLGFLIMGTVISMWVTDMAVAAMMTPLGVALLKSADIKPGKSNFGKALMISCCWGAVFGGIGTPAGCGPNPIAIEYLKNLAGLDVSFLDWMKIGVPAALILVPFGWLVLSSSSLRRSRELPLEQEEIKKRLRGQGKALPAGGHYARRISLGHYPLDGHRSHRENQRGAIVLSMEMVAMVGGLVFFLPGHRIMTWEEAEPLMNWDSIVLVLASLALGLMMYKTGAARWLSWILLGNLAGFSPVIQIALIIAAVMLMKLFLGFKHRHRDYRHTAVDNTGRGPRAGRLVRRRPGFVHRVARDHPVNPVAHQHHPVHVRILLHKGLRTVRDRDDRGDDHPPYPGHLGGRAAHGGLYLLRCTRTLFCLLFRRRPL